MIPWHRDAQTRHRDAAARARASHAARMRVDQDRRRTCGTTFFSWRRTSYLQTQDKRTLLQTSTIDLIFNRPEGCRPESPFADRVDRHDLGADDLFARGKPLAVPHGNGFVLCRVI